ncbi:MAG: GreA/GreB family elongation factor [Akkermansia sp.]|nr:GreA/GreB family elongation factor [Akkermansia sp.]
MHGDLEKLVAAGKIPADFAMRLDKFSPANYVMHPEWGVGKVEAWSLAKNLVKVNFEQKPHFVMGLKLAFNQLTPVPEGHFLITCFEDAAGCRAKAEGKDTILEFIAFVLQHNLSLREGVNEVLEMEPEDLEKFLSGRVIPAENWKAWWEKARTAMKEDPRFRLPTKKGETIRTREASSAAEALLADYTEATSLESCVRIIDQSHIEALAGEYTLAARLVKAMEEDIERDRSEPQHVLELIIIRDDILEATTGNDAAKQEQLNAALTEAGVTELKTLADKLKTIPSEELVQYIGELSVARQNKVYEALPEAYADSWLAYTTNIFLFGGAKVTAAAADFIIAKGGKDQLFADLTNGISRQNLSPDVLIWICRERNGVAKELVDKNKMLLGAAIINAIERDSAEGGPNRALRLRNLLLDDKELAPDLVTGISELEARPFAKSLYDSSVLPDLDRNLLLANMMKVHPTLQEVVLARVQVKEKQHLYVSLRSYAARKAEYEELINVKIPKNKHDLEITRAEGDLRENGGYQDAKATRQVLMRRSEELSRLLSQAEPTDFADASCEQTGVGTQVIFTNNKGLKAVYTILGAWDSIPEQGVIPYNSKLGARLIGHKVGDAIRIPLEVGGSQHKMTIQEIVPAPKELIFPDDEA